MNSVQSVALFYYNITHIFRWVNKKEKFEFSFSFSFKFLFFIFFLFYKSWKENMAELFKKKKQKKN